MKTLLCILIVITQACGIHAFGATPPPSDIHPATSEDISQLNEKLELQAATINDLKSTIASLQQSIDQSTTAVMFSAWLDHNIKLEENRIVIYNQVLTNTDNVYSPITGGFRVPVSGYYLIQVDVYTQYDHRVSVGIYQNSERLFKVYADYKLRFQSSSGQMGVVLQKGDTVSVKCTGFESFLSGDTNRYNRFSGYLVAPL